MGRCRRARLRRRRPVYGIRRADGGLTRQPSPQDWAWLAHLGEQLERLPGEWDAVLSDEDPLTTLVVEVTAALSEAGLPLHDDEGPRSEAGGACLIPEPDLGGIVVSWRQHDRMSVDQVHGAVADTLVQQAMNRALAEVLAARGFAVDAFGGASGHVVRSAACSRRTVCADRQFRGPGTAVRAHHGRPIASDPPGGLA